jgi:plasmid stabilization system protein ParE
MKVVLSPKAKASLHDFAAWWATHRSHEQAQRWYDGFVETLDALGANPEWYPIARESSRFPVEIREVSYGTGSKPTHRAVFTIRQDMVYILAIRHLAQDDLTAESIGGE